jgi:hypothetical protein
MKTRLGSAMTHTAMRDAKDVSDLTGMCSVCTMTCVGPCEIGLSALRGTEAIYPYQTDLNQFGSNKPYPLDWSHFNINGRVFGAEGCPENSTDATFNTVNLTTTFGIKHPVPVKIPVIMPAMAKLNWRDYFAGAALAGIPVVIGEDVVAKDPALEIQEGKVTASPLIADMIKTYRDHYHGFGDVILQANEDDEHLKVLDYAINKLGVKSVEFKYGQASKGIQGIGRVKSHEAAAAFSAKGYIIHPDPKGETSASDFENKIAEPYEKVGKLPFWDETYMAARISEVRALGALRVCFKLGPYTPSDLLRIMMIASDNRVDLVTIDGAGGGTGNSPVKMMNEWGIPTIELIQIMKRIYQNLEAKGKHLPQLAIGGGIVMEDQAFKALALGAPYIKFVAIGRASMAAAMTGKKAGDDIQSGHVPQTLKDYGDTIEGCFADYSRVQKSYARPGQVITTGTIGVYSYMDRLTYGLKQLFALNRKFTLGLIDASDIVSLTDVSQKITGVLSYKDLLDVALSEGGAD